MAYQNIKIEINDGIAVLTLNRPEVRNALDYVTWDEIRAGMRELRFNDDAHVIILTGAGGKAFASGADIKALNARTVSEQMNSEVNDILYEITMHKKPVIAAVDGYALAAADTFGCGEASPALLRLAGRVEMGRAPDFALSPGECAEIPTGGRLPEGADAVVMLEHAEDYGSGLVGILKGAAPGAGVVFRGDDLKPGQAVLRAGRRLRPMDIGALAAMGAAEPRVRKKPRAAVLSTGDELVPPELTPGPGQVRDVNGPMLCALLEALGAEAAFLGIVRDEEAELERAVLAAAEGYDLVLVSGGSSAGERDAVARVIGKNGRLLFHGLAMRPGKPAMLGEVHSVPVLGLPGHPAAAYLTAKLLAGALLRSLLGQPAEPRPVPARLTEPLPANDGRELHCGVRLSREGGELYAEPVRTKSGLISALAASDGVLRVPRDCEGLPRGALVEVELEEF